MNKQTFVKTAAGLTLGVGTLFLSPAALASSCGTSDFKAPTLYSQTAQTFGGSSSSQCGSSGEMEANKGGSGGNSYGGSGGHSNSGGGNGGGFGAGGAYGGDHHGGGFGGGFGNNGPKEDDWFHHHGNTGGNGDGPTCAPVPLPAGVWLLASGAAGLMGFARKRKNHTV